MRRVRISLTQDVLLKHYNPYGIKSVFIYPGYDVDRNIEVSGTPVEAEVTEETYDNLINQEVNGTKLFNVEDVEIIEAEKETEEKKAEEEYKARQKQRGK